VVATKQRNQRVGVVIVNWNTAPYLERALESFLRDGVGPNHIVVVDQGSRDGSARLVREKYGGVKILSLQENQSYAMAINAGASLLNADFLIVANADVEFNAGVIARLLVVAEHNMQIALVGPRLRNGNGLDVTRFSRTGSVRAFLLLLAPSYSRGWWRKIEQRRKQGNSPVPVPFVEGCFMLIRRAAFEELGGFDETFSFFFEDADFAIRLKKLGYDLFHCPNAEVTHFGGASFAQIPERARREFYKNCLLFYRKHSYRKYVWLKRAVGLILQNISTGGVPQLMPILPRSPLVSVIIPTYERVDCLIQLLDSIKAQSYRKFEVIVVDQSKTKDSRKERAFRKFREKLVVIRTVRANRSLAKNLGMRHAGGDILLFCDDDIVVQPDFLQTHITAYLNRSIGAVSCRVTEDGLPRLNSTRILKITPYGQMIAGFQSDVTCYVNSLVGGNMSILHSLQKSVGEFDISFGGTSVFEEPDYSARILQRGFKILFTNRTSAHHIPQGGGNVFLKKEQSSWYYHWFHHNEILYFLKNHSRLNLLLVIPFCLLRTAKQSRKFKMNIHDTVHVLKGISEGFKTYYRLYS
jgi:N-acetylglucosaminyl-diphospho-decaprenol L-rhamnosyltransferase